jgi:hypothetical protein
MLKGIIQPNHIPLNKFQLFIVGVPPITFVTVSGIEEVLQIVDMPDRTKASGGQTNPVEFQAQTMLHHLVERIALEAWFKEGQDPVTPTYKKIGTLILKGIQDNVLATYTLPGLFIFNRKLPDLDIADEGNPAMAEWSFSADDVLPI